MAHRFLVALTMNCCLLSAPGLAATHNVNCDTGEKIQDKVSIAKPGDAILVTGICAEGVRIQPEMVRITLDGQGKAVVRVSGSADGIFVYGKDITIKGFTLTGGRDGIHLSGQAAGAAAIIDSNVIRDTGRFGIHIDKNSYATIINNVIENVGSTGIDITENSFARIGFSLPGAPKPAPNTIQNNGRHGISVTRISGAWIAYNRITQNKGSGIYVNRNSQADIVDNVINGHGGDGSQNSGVNLRSEDAPFPQKGNRTDAETANAGFAVRCSTGGYVEGPLGNLSGNKGPKDFEGSCIDRTVP
jgi:Periplasmic copper-binding protein (NosD)